MKSQKWGGGGVGGGWGLKKAPAIPVIVSALGALLCIIVAAIVSDSKKEHA